MKYVFYLFCSLVVLIILGIGVHAFFSDTGDREVAPNPEQRACTMEAKLCPDGSAVGRTGPNCEFAPCPGEEPN